jgi:hypothetical protein
MAGNMNFYDLPFPSKVIFRNNAESWPSAGTHTLKNPSRAKEVHLRPEELSTAHFPFLTKARLLEKAKQGELLIKAGFPAGHGWQSQMIHALLQANRLDEFWDTHSNGKQVSRDGRILPSFVIDDRFSRAIDQTLAFLENGFESHILDRITNDESSGQSLAETQISFRTMVRVARKFQLIADSIRVERNNVLDSTSCKSRKIFKKNSKILFPPNSAREIIFHHLIRPFQKQFQNKRF